MDLASTSDASFRGAVGRARGGEAAPRAGQPYSVSDRPPAPEVAEKPKFSRRREDVAAREALPADSPERDENFKRWFAGSKVVDESGAPKRL